MNDLRQKLEKLRADANDFAHRSRSAADASQCELFGRLAEQLALEALELEQVVKKETEHSGSSDPPKVATLRASSKKRD